MTFSNNTEDPMRNPLFFWWSVALLFEGALILLGNALTIVVFCRRRRFAAMKRAAYLLINLAFADFLVGVGVIVSGVVGISITPFSQQELPQNILAMFIYLAATASIFSLAVVAVERAFAIATPLKHRTAATAYYYHAVRLVWVMATLVSVCAILSTFVKLHAFNFVVVFVLSSCLLIICLSYFIIWWTTSKRSSGQTAGEQTAQRDQQLNRKLATTLLIVTFLSLVTWMPCQVMMTVGGEDGSGVSVTLSVVFLFFEFANSFLNPFVYVLRMPEFRREIKLLLRCSGREEVVPMADI